MAPEQAQGQETGPAADLYATGVIAYELVTGTLPYSGTDPMSILWGHVHEPLPAVLSRKPDVDPRLADWVERLLEKDPSRRPPGARQALDELKAIKAHVLEPARTVAAPDRRSVVRSFMSPMNLAVPLAVAIAALLLDALWLFAVAAAAYAALVVIAFATARGREH
jgi:serine/threonine protein kinase